jgi:hypothetical protein
MHVVKPVQPEKLQAILANIPARRQSSATQA